MTPSNQHFFYFGLSGFFSYPELMKEPPQKDISTYIGQKGESLGCHYLKRKGYQILMTNYYNPTGRRLGEIDIIAKEGTETVFIEVKTRALKKNISTLPEESITRNKLRKLEKVALHYLRNTGGISQPHRFDALSIIYDPQRKVAKIRHLKYIYI